MYCVTCQTNMMTHVKLLYESLFDPHIC